MVNQNVFLPMIPDSAPIVVNISQNDYDAAGYAGRLFFNLINNGVAYDMDGASALFQGEKPDGTTFAYSATVVNASVVRVNVRQQMTVVAGRVVCQLILSNSDGQVGSFNVWLEVQPSSAAGGDPSQTDIPALIAQAKQYADDAEQSAQDAASYTGHPPYIGANGNWFVYDLGTDAYIDSGVYAAGSEGDQWYTGTAVYGKDPTAHVFPTGITLAREGDMYLNKNEGAIYHCTLGGDDTVAKWAYDMTLTGGGGGTDDYNDLNNRPQINGVVLSGNKTPSDLNIKVSNLGDTDITSPTDGQILEYDGNNNVWKNGDNISSFARYGGSKTFAQLTGALLVAANEDKFYLCTDGGTISAGDAGNWILPANSVIPPDSHIAVVNVGTSANPDYKFDDFGGYVDISGKADKTQLDAWTTTEQVLSNQVTFTGIDDDPDVGLYVYFVTTTAVNYYAKLKTVTNANTHSMSVTYETDAPNGTIVKLRIIK